jgi:hypothetical protein
MMMGIRLYPEGADAQGLPVVIWDEDRKPMFEVAPVVRTDFPLR